MPILKHFFYLIICCLLFIMAACSSSDFKITGNIDGLGTQNVRITYMSDAGMRDTFVTTQNDEFSYVGSSAVITVVSVWDAQGTLLARLTAKNGDKLSIEGDKDELPLVKIGGNEVNDQWMKFRTQNIKYYTNPDRRPLDKIIKEWVKAHPDKLLSTILLMWDTSDLTSHDEITALLGTINPEARPDNLLESYEAIMSQVSKKTKYLHSLTLCGASGDFEALSLDKKTLLYFWRFDDADRNTTVRAVKALGNDSRVADVLLDADTTGWLNRCRTDSATWRHYWSPGGVTEHALQHLNIPATPHFVAVDSTGTILYQGSDLTKAAAIFK